MLEIRNAKRKKQIEEFIDDEHREVASKYYEIFDRHFLVHDLKRKMKGLIKKDRRYFDPYLMLADILYDEGKIERSRKIRELAFRKAMLRVVNKDGKFPKVLSWGWLENRHIIRAIQQGALLRWEEGKTEEALEIFRNLLKSNPKDNIGPRYDILAIKMNLGPDYEEQFQSSERGFIDASKIYRWFEIHSKKFTEEFGWWWNEMEQQGLENRLFHEIRDYISHRKL
ncbi:MAG: hypothetical protein R6U96_11585 [Promethearchaeia archaeon]